jgi:hypothetical protein
MRCACYVSALVLSCVTVGTAAAQEVLSPYPPPPPGPVLSPYETPGPTLAPAAPLAPPYALPPLVVAPPCPSMQCAPARVREVDQPRYGLMTAGLVVLGASWSINAAVAYGADEWRLAVPVAGPFLETQRVDTSPGHEANRMLVGMLVFDGLIETAGATMLIAGAATRHRVRVYDRSGVTVVPTAGWGSAGLAAYGRF